MSVGRQLAMHLISTAEDLRRYALLADEFEDDALAQVISADARSLAQSLELLTRPILNFEGENMRALMSASVSS